MLCFQVVGQQQELKLEDFVPIGTFKPKSVEGLKPMNDNIHFTLLEEGGSRVIRYSFVTGRKVDVLVDIPSLKNSTIKSIDGYYFNHDETRMLVYTNKDRIYRHSFMADYFVIDLVRMEIAPLSENGKQREAIFSPNGNLVAFVRDNDIYVKNLRFGTETAITNDGKEDEIINGLPDWAYEEEFGYTRAFEWSPNSQELAFKRFDKSGVMKYSFPIYMASHPSNPQYELYPGEYSYRYPKVGTANSIVTVNVFNLRDRTTKTMSVGEKDGYIPRLIWTTRPDQLAVVTLNRRQNELKLHVVNPASGVANLLFTDRNNRFVCQGVLDNIFFLEDGKHFVYVGELDGFNHIHLLRIDGSAPRQVTKGQWDVTAFLGFDSRERLFFFEAAAITPLTREVYSIRMDGTRMTRLTPRDGTNEAWFSNDFRHFMVKHSSASTPPVYTLHNRAGREIGTFEDNSELTAVLANYQIPDKEFFQFTTSAGVNLNGWMIKPLNFDAALKYPVLLVQYSGPNTQRVRDRWEMGWEFYLASRGYIVVSVDGRGTGARGEEFRKQTYLRLGLMESDDQIETANYLATKSFVDSSRVGIWGWSYGGLVTLLSMSRSDVFRAGIAVAPVTDWRYYNTIYTERFMRTQRENPVGYTATSPLNLATNLRGKLLLVHGTADNNVHFQNTMEYSDRLIQEGIGFNMFVYPNRGHDLTGGNTRNHLFRMKVSFLERNLKNIQPVIN